MNKVYFTQSKTPSPIMQLYRGSIASLLPFLTQHSGVWEEWDLFQPAAFPWEHVPVLLWADQFEPPGEYHRWCSNEVSSPEVWGKWLPIVLFPLLFYPLFSLRSSRPLYLSFYSFSSVKMRKMWLSSAWWALRCHWWTRCRLFLEKSF